MACVRDLMDAKGGDIWSTTPDTSVYDALVLMADKGIGALLVTNGDRLVGIMSERDYARKVILMGKSSRETKVSDIMSTKVYYVNPRMSVEECMAVMTDKTVRHLPVLEEKALVGIVSIGDVVKAMISKQEFIIDQLEQYISGR